INPKQAKVVSEIVRTTERATRILNDLLDLTRSSFGTEIPLIKAKTSMFALCQDIADEFRRIDDGHQIHVKLVGDPHGLWDQARMGQVLSNLLGNAVQHGRVASPINVAISGVDPETLSVSVHNFGEPISAEEQRVIFHSWMRGQVNDLSNGNHLGLGLYIAKLIVEAHGGEIAVTSDGEEGTTFTFQLPRA
ncbi:MAG TPA: HAMP domain-containing sensor histidine kinase, partial [Bryobacteraceae bacterium]|nr:HAMP domain-containing sensor histidine kinase [Bryobacteraceae bacterium]